MSSSIAEKPAPRHPQTLGDVRTHQAKAKLLSRWLAAKESQQTWRFEQHPQLRKALVIAMAEDDSGVIVRTVIEVKNEKVVG